MCKLLVFLSRNNHCYQCISYRSRDTHSIFMCRHRYLYRYTMEREKAIDTDNFFFYKVILYTLVCASKNVQKRTCYKSENNQKIVTYESL